MKFVVRCGFHAATKAAQFVLLALIPACTSVPQVAQEAKVSQTAPATSQGASGGGYPPPVTAVQLSIVDVPAAAAVGLTADRPLPFGPGSGLAFLERRSDRLLFLYVTDRGPNAEAAAPQQKTFGKDTKVFPVPGFLPRFGVLETPVDGRQATVDAGKSLEWQGKPLSGLPPGKAPTHGAGAQVETGLNPSGKVLGPDALGIDPEGIALGRKGLIYISEEYGPSVLGVEQATGKVVTWWWPGKGLPEVFARRQPNRGFEGLAATPSGDVVAMLQSPIARTKAGKGAKGAKGGKKAFEPFIRGVQMRDNRPLRELQLTLDDRFADWGDAKVGDLTAIDDDAFVLILQGKLKAGGREAYLVLAAVQGSCQGAEASLPCVTLATKDLVTLSTLNWRHEKTEGLALVGPREVALINDNDFGVVAEDGKAPTELLRVTFDKDFTTMAEELRQAGP